MARGVSLVLVSARRWNEGGKDVEFDPGLDDFAVTSRTLGRHPSVFVMAPQRLWRLLGQPWDVLDLHEEPNALITAEVLLLRALRRSRVPFVLYSAQNIEKRYPPPFRWIERWSLHQAAGAYVCNTEAGEILARKGLRPPARLIGLGVDLEQYHPAEPAADGSGLRVGYVGRLESHKGVAVLLEALAGLPDATLDIAGAGPQATELEQLAHRLGLADRARFRGHLGPDLPAFYRTLDVLAVPSIPTRSWREQFCRVAVEAMASGVPVVASRTGAIPDVVGDAGILVPPGEPELLRGALEDLRDPDRRASLAARGLHRARRYGWGEIAEQHLELYRDVAVRPIRPVVDVAERPPPEVVIVAYGSTEPLREALAPLEGLSVTVVDNSSSAETAELVARTGAHYVDPGRNLGFAAGVNRALRSLAERGRSSADVLLLNPDAVISADSVLALQRALHGKPGLACVAPEQVSPVSGETERVQWPFPRPAAAWLGAIGGGRWDRRPGFVIGSILLLNRAALDDVGEFDERFFLYSEETDWQFRAVQRGWSIGFVPEVHGTHVGAGTGGSSDRRLVLFHSSLVSYMEKHYGRLGRASFQTAMIAGALVRSLVPREPTRSDARRRLRLYLRAQPVAGPE